MNSKILTKSKALGLLLLALCFFISPMNLFASTQQSGNYRVTGIVKDATGESIIGASVLEKGTNNGIITDIDGNFSLSVTPNSTVVISFIGYATQEFVINQDNMQLNVTLKEDSKMIDEVVVVGYGTQKSKLDWFCFSHFGQRHSRHSNIQHSLPIARTYARSYDQSEWWTGR